MAIFAAAAAVFASASAINSIVAGNRARHDAEAQAREEKRLEERVTKEKLRQLDKQEEELRGATIAAAAGAGVKADRGSPLVVLAEQASEFDYERSVTRDVGASRAATALASGRAVGQRAQAQGYTQGFQGLSTMFSIIASSRAGPPPGQ